MSFFSLTRIFVFGTAFASLTCCMPVEIILHGEIKGGVTDASTGLPLAAASVILSPLSDTLTTGDDGKFLFGNLAPDNYEIEVSKLAYDRIRQNVTVAQAETKELTFPMNGVPAPKISDTYLDFGLDSVVKHFTISNSGKGKLEYIISAAREWINISPAGGDCTYETDTVTVTINKTGLPAKKLQDVVKIFSVTGQDITRDDIDIYLNGVMDEDMNYYNAVRIGSQTWMAENMNTGKSFMFPTNNGIVEKFCYEDDDHNCSLNGGLYGWSEMMQYAPPDSGRIGITKGICPVGWHIPTRIEWETLIISAGGETVAGAKLMEAGTANWVPPNSVATNETGFTALPAGYYAGAYKYYDIGSKAYFWSSSKSPETGKVYKMILSKDASIVLSNDFLVTAGSVRCLKDSPKH